MTELIGRAAADAARPGTRVTATRPSWGVDSAEGFYDSFISAASMLDLLTSWNEPFDGVVMAGFGEHGREGARQLLDVPVVDITEAAAMFAASVGHLYGVVTTTASSVQQIRQSLGNAGLLGRCAGVRATQLRVLDLHLDLDRTVDAFVAETEILMEAGADTLVLGCAGMAGLQQSLEQKLGIPVVDGVAAGVSLCESLIHQNLRTSKIGTYAPPDLAKKRPGWPRHGRASQHGQKEHESA
jgi:allantoin racemase